MPKQKTDYQKAAGKLISSIQKVWGSQLGEGGEADFTEDVLGRAHKLLQARTVDKGKELLGGLTLSQFLGEVWVQKHSQQVEGCIDELQRIIEQKE